MLRLPLVKEMALDGLRGLNKTTKSRKRQDEEEALRVVGITSQCASSLSSFDYFLSISRSFVGAIIEM